MKHEGFGLNFLSFIQFQQHSNKKLNRFYPLKSVSPKIANGTECIAPVDEFQIQQNFKFGGTLGKHGNISYITYSKYWKKENSQSIPENSNERQPQCRPNERTFIR